MLTCHQHAVSPTSPTQSHTAPRDNRDEIFIANTDSWMARQS